MSRKIAQFAVSIVAVCGLILLAAQFVVYIVDQRELAVVMRFGEPVRSQSRPGMYFKTPFIETVRKFPSTLQFWGDDPAELLPDLPTKDDKKIEIVPWAVWRISDPIAFVKRMRTLENAENRVAQFARGAIRDVITVYDLEDLVRSTNREMKMAQLEFDEESMTMLQEALPDAELMVAAPKSKGLVGRQAILAKINAVAHESLETKEGAEAGDNRGIELVDVGISRIDFVDSVRQTTFKRWIAEREAISTLNIKEGEERKQEILNKTNAEIEKIQGEGQREASEMRGRADAEVIKRYADAIGEVGDFYTFVRTLEAYEKSIDQSTELILTTDNGFLKQLQVIGEAAPAQ
ncbi:protease modulator HflC [Aureliella helgolandensis]|uniref:Protein HflC n=1 Tax=Aureliella helgolandensis TaxID=2527968 RepID=A0A518FZP7_9BACT|nr:protease modulator HflC [Aureliella helgolandensis]QDV21796.1 Modulator of FtsH protease HflC [Aureliella helgolandensis]